MMAYLEEVKTVTSKLHKLGCIDQFFEQNLLMAVDEGWGEELFVDAIRDTLLPYFGVSDKEASVYLVHVDKEKSSTYWENKIDFVKGIVKTAKSKGSFAVIVCELLEHVENLNSIVFISIMEKFAKELKDALFIMWIPYETESLRRFANSKLSSVMPLRMIELPPISKEQQIEYMSQYLNEKSFQINDDCHEKLVQWIEQKEDGEGHNGYSTLENMCDTLIYQKVLKDDDVLIQTEDIEGMLVTPKEDDDAYELLKELIGMSQLKAKIKEIVAQIKLQKQLVKMGKKIESPSLHMAFLGNPGTGKTTLARILGQIFKQEKILRKGEFFEHSGNEFIEGNIAEIIRKTRKACKESYGSVMFIDEAYGMAIGHSNGNTGDDVIPILVEEMENHRDDMCIIFAGYEDEMETFFKANSGIKSRIPHILHFPNYSKEELFEIFIEMAEGCFEYEEELKEILQDYLENIPGEYYDAKDFGNARFIRNLYERVWGKAAYRINFTEDKEIILKKEDIQAALKEDMFAAMQGKKEKRRIGFEMK